MGSATITIEGFEKIIAKYGTAQAHSAVNKALQSTVEFTAAQVKGRIAGSHHVTGFLLSSIRGQASGSEGKSYAEHGAGVYYAAFVENGTGIYGPKAAPYGPKAAKRLAWHSKTVTGTPKSGGWVVRKSVKGQPAVHMFHDTFTQDAGKLTDHFGKKFREQFLKG